MLDLAITGGTCVLPTGTQAADIGVTGGRSRWSARRARCRTRRAPCRPSGRLVIPGGIDPHIHCLLPIESRGSPSRTAIRRRRSAAPRCTAAPRR